MRILYVQRFLYVPAGAGCRSGSGRGADARSGRGAASRREDHHETGRVDRGQAELTREVGEIGVGVGIVIGIDNGDGIPSAIRIQIGGIRITARGGRL